MLPCPGRRIYVLNSVTWIEYHTVPWDETKKNVTFV
jgi:hypothetical protein